MVPEVPARKRRRVGTASDVGFKKEFDAPPSTLSDRPPSSQKSLPFKTMVSDWWLQSHPGAKTLDGGTWLVGFYDHMKEDLHIINKEYLKELDVWHKAKGT